MNCKRLARNLLEHGVKTELGIIKGRRRDSAWRDYRCAAILGDTQAQFFLALNYAAGLDGHKSRRLAMAWFRRAVCAGEELCTLVSDKRDLLPEDLIRMFGKLIMRDVRLVCTKL